MESKPKEMKKTLSINISGSIFNIDEDAYQTLEKYIQNLKSHYKNTEEGIEIIHDIEARIAEIFIENTSIKTEVIDKRIINNLINILGKPEEIFEEEEEEEEETTEYSKETENSKNKKSFYRDPINDIIAGVASGLSAYIGINVKIIRSLFILSFICGYGYPIIIYIIVWIITPKAKTASQRLEMEGKKINIENIDKHIKDEYNYIKNEIKNINNKKSISSIIEKITIITEPTVKLLLKIGIVILGLCLITTGIISIISLTASLTSGLFSLDLNKNIISMFIDSSQLKLFIIALPLSILIPVILLILLGLKLILGLKYKSKQILISSFVIWIISLIIITSTTISQITNFRTSATQNSISESIELSNFKTITIKAQDNENVYKTDNNIEYSTYSIVQTDNDELIAGKVSLDIKKSKNNNVYIRIDKSSRGKNYNIAKQNSNNLNYKWNETDSIISLNNYFIIDKTNKWRLQKLKISILIPEGQIIRLDNSLNKIISNVQNTSNTWDLDMLDKKWIMKKEGLTEY